MNKNRESHVSLHLMFAVDTAEEAQNAAKEVAIHLAPYYSTSIHNIQQYWKIPEYFEATLNVHCQAMAIRHTADIAHILGSCWLQLNTDYIWNAEKHARFVCDKVRWVNAQWIE